MFADGVMESSSTTGTDDYVLTGSVYNGLTFSQKYEDEAPAAFIAQTLDRSQYEIVAGSFDLGPPRKLRRTTILASSNGGAKIDWAEDDVYYIASFASADALAGLVTKSLASARPWWVKLTDWLEEDYDGSGRHAWNFWDGLQDIQIGIVDTVKHVIEWAICKPGTIQMTAASGGADPGWLLCDGAVVSQTTYARLYSRIGTAFNTGGEGAGNFRLPSFDLRVPVGSGTAAIGATGGATTHSHDDGTLAAATSGLGVSGTVTSTSLALSAGSGVNAAQGGDTISGTVGTNADVTGNTGSSSSYPPYAVVKFQIKT